MDPSVADGLVANIAAMYLSREAKAIADAKDGTINPAKILNQTIADFQKLYSPKSEHNANKDKKYWKGMREKFNALKEYPNFVKAAVSERLRLLAVESEENEYELEKFEDEQGLRNVSDYKRDQTMMGGFASMSTQLKKYIATTTIQASDEFGNTELTPGESLIIPVDFVDAYNGILKAVN
jgi:hypothetical protein